MYISKKYLFNNELINCKCGCGNLINKYDKKGRERRFIRGHQNRNKTYSELHKKHLSESHKGYIMPENQREKIGKCNLGRIGWSKGLTKETDDRIRKICEKNKGRTISILTRQKISLGVKNNLPKTYFKIGEKRVREIRTKTVFPNKDTSIEVKIQNFLKELGIEYFTHQYIKEIEHGYQCDILIPSMNLVIECDGDYWHKYPIGNDIDHIRTSELIEKGFKVLRLWEFEIKKMDLNDFKERLNGI
jgi:very-short-patch-repair endonuclease